MTPELLAVGAAVAVVLVPGAFLGYAIGLRGLALLGLSGPIGVALCAGIPVLSALLGVPFAWWHSFLVAAIALGVRLVLRRRALDAPLRLADVAVAAAIAVSSVAAALVAFRGVALSAVNSTYDGVFHLNAVAYILATGNGSSVELYRMAHPGTDPIEFYPAAWHDVVAATVQLTGAAIPLATNATWIAVTATVWIPGVVYLAATAFGRGGPLLAALLAAPLATAFAAAPYLLLDWGTLFPTGLAYALLPAGLALVAQVLRRTDGAPALPRLLLWSSAALWGVAAVLSHPRSLFSFVVLAFPLAVAWAVAWAARRWADPRGRRVVLLTGGGLLAGAAMIATAGWIYVYRTYDVANRPISDHLNGGPATARQGIGESLLQALLNAPVVSPTETPAPPAWLLSAVTVGALVTAVVVRRWRWAALAWLLVVVLYCLAAGSNSDIAKLATGIWYKDKYRLISLLPVILAPLTAGALALLARAVRGRTAGRRRTLASAALAVLTGGVIAAAWLGPTLGAVRDGIGAVYRVPDGPKDGALLDADQLALLERLPDLVPEDAVVVGNPWNGSTLTWAVGGREPLFPHLTGDWDPDRLTVATRLDQFAVDPEVCAALDRLGADYLMTSDGLLWNGDPQAEAFAGIDRTDPDAIGEAVASSGGTALHRITACG